MSASCSGCVLEQHAHLFVMQTFDFQNNKETKMITQKSQLVDLVVLEQAHLFVMEAINFQNSNQTMKITQKAHMVAHGEL